MFRRKIFDDVLKYESAMSCPLEPVDGILSAEVAWEADDPRM